MLNFSSIIGGAKNSFILRLLYFGMLKSLAQLGGSTTLSVNGLQLTSYLTGVQSKFCYLNKLVTYLGIDFFTYTSTMALCTFLLSCSITF